MRYDPAKHHRRSIRLRDYNYSQNGMYFVTLCTQGRKCLFGDVVDGEMRLNAYGQIIQDEWLRTSAVRHEAESDAFQVMPNHLHAIVVITGGAPSTVGATGRSPLQAEHQPPHGPAKRSLGSLVAGFKSGATKNINQRRGTPGAPVWQRSYYDHVIRNEADLNRIRQYILDNPAKWPEDAENPDRSR